MKQQRKRWTEEEDQFLRDNARTKMVKEIASELGKSVHSVYKRMKVLNLKEPAYRKWTSEEDEYLINKYGKCELDKIARILKRDKNSLMRRLHRLGKANAKECFGITTYELAKALKIDVGSVYRWINDRELPYKKAYAKERTFLVIDVQEFWDWAEENKRLINFSKIEKHVLIPEPAWVDKQRKLDFHHRPQKERQKWTKEEDERIWQLFYCQGMTYKDIGALMGRSARAVQNRLARVRLNRQEIVPKQSLLRQCSKSSLFKTC